jgi:hypothetical protein
MILPGCSQSSLMIPSGVISPGDSLEGGSASAFASVAGLVKENVLGWMGQNQWLSQNITWMVLSSML